ncbi:MAG: TonB-dependent siderophore receptor [Pseudomonadota bacterium]
MSKRIRSRRTPRSSQLATADAPQASSGVPWSSNSPPTAATVLAGAVYLASLPMASPSLGQSSADPQEMEEVLVSARYQNSLVNRLPISIEELPYSLSIIDRDFIDDRGFVRPLAALQTLPNVVLEGDEFNSGAPFFLVRGFAASILVNNRPETNSRGFGRRDDSFVERYEVLKGPASISLGPILPGGIINTVTKLPQEEAFLRYELSAGSFGTHRLQLDGNAGALGGNESIRGRMTVSYENIQSPQPLEERETFAIRPVIDFNIGERTRGHVSAAYKESDSVPSLPFAIFQDGRVPAAFDNETFFGPPANVGAQGDDTLIDGELQHEFLDNLKLTLRGSYQETDLDYQNTQGLYNYNFDEGRFGIAPSNPVGNFYASTGTFDEDVTYFDGQLAWNTALGSTKVDVVVGATSQETNELSTFGFDGFNAVVNINSPDFLALPVPVNTATPTPFFDGTIDLVSFYSEAIFRPTEWLTIPVGVRRDDLENTLRDPTSGGDDLAEDDFVQETTEDFDDTSFRIGATAAVTDDINVYISFAESFVPQSGVLRSGSAIGPETAESIEIGVKAQFLQGRLSVQSAIFDTVRENVANADPNNTVGENFVVGVGEQTHQGFELAVNGALTDALNLSLSYGYLDAEFTRDLDGNQGLRPSVAPDHTFSTYLSYTFDSGVLRNLQVGAGARYLSDRPGSTGSGLEYDGYELFDMFATYQLSDSVKLRFNINNVTDEEYLESVGNSGRPAGGFVFGDPRTFLFTLEGGF